MRAFLAGGLFVVAVGLAFAWSARGRLAEVEASNAVLQAEIDQLDALGATAVDPAVVEELRTQLELIDALRAGVGRAAGVVVAAGDAVPPGAWLTDLEFAAGRFELVGGAEDPDAVALLFDELQGWPCLANPALGGVRRSEDGYRWSITARASSELPACAGAGTARDPFESPAVRAARDAVARRARMPALMRFDVREFRLVGVEAAVATLQDPLGGRHQAIAGSPLGASGGRVQQVLPRLVIVVEEELVDAETGELRSEVITLDLDPPSPFAEPIPRPVPQ